VWRNTFRRDAALHFFSVPVLSLAFQIMSRVGSWGQHYEIMAAAAYFHVYIVVFQPNRPVEYAVFGKQEHPFIFLQNNDELHYVWMRPEYQ